MIDIETLDEKQLCRRFDHTLLKAYASSADLEKLCTEARDNGFGMVAINSSPVSFCKEILKESDVHVGAAISFPLGQTTIETKCFETEKAITDELVKFISKENGIAPAEIKAAAHKAYEELKATQKAIEEGADEIDYVINIGKVKDRDYDYIRKEMKAIVAICRSHNVTVKAIFENCYLEKEEIVQLCLIAVKEKPDFIKTSTGFGTSGATVEDVKLMKETVGEEVKVKAAGGIRD